MAELRERIWFPLQIHRNRLARAMNAATQEALPRSFASPYASESEVTGSGPAMVL
jgi:hypothetical protein